MARDFAVFAILASVLFVLGWRTEAWGWLHDRLEDSVGGAADEVYGAITVAAIVFAALSIRRSLQATRESVRRAELEHRFRAVIEEGPAISYTRDLATPAGTPPSLYVSPQIEAVMGFTQEEWTSDPLMWIEHLHPEDRDRVVAESGHTDATGEPFTSEYRILTKDGREIWLRDESRIVARDGAGRPRKVQGVMYEIGAQKRAEAALQEAENRYRTIVERVPTVAYVWDSAVLSGSAPASYISPQVETLLGFSAEAWMEDPKLWATRVHPDDLPDVMATWDRATATSGPFASEYRIFAADGALMWLRDEALPVSVGERGHAVYQGVMFDITEQRETVEQLRRTEERYRSLVEQLPVVTYLSVLGHGSDTDPVLYVAPGIAQLTGYTAEDWLAEPGIWERLLHPADRDRVMVEARRTGASGDPFDMEYRLIRMDGMPVWVHDAAQMVGRDDTGGPGVWQGVLEDITQRKNAESRLAAAEARFRTLVEQIPAITYIEDRETGAITYIIPQIERVMGYTPEEWIADPELWEECLHPDDRDRVVAGNEADTGDTWRIDYRAIARDGRTLWLHNDAHLIHDEDGTPRYWQGVVLDITARKESEERIREAEARYRSLVEQIPAITYIEDHVTNRVIYVSPQLETVLGYTQEELPRERFWASLHEDDRARVQAEDQRTNLTGEPYRVQYRQRTKDARWVWIRDEAVLIRDEHGEPVYWQGVRFDITGQREAEQQVRDAEEKYRTLIETVPAVTYIDTVTEPVTAIYVSPQIEAMLGFTPDEWVGDPDLWWDHLDPDLVDEARTAVTRHSDGEPFDLEYRFRTKDGTWRWIRDQALVVTDDEGVPRFSQGVMVDITDEKLSEEQLRAAEQRFRAIVEHIPAVVYIDPVEWPSETVYVSPELERMLGISAEDWSRDLDSWEHAIHPDDRAGVVRDYLTFTAERGQWLREYRFVAVDGRVIWVRDEASILPDEHGQPEFVQGVWFDITERKLAEQALQESERREREAAERLRALDEMKNTFLAAVSHELRSPLTSILGLSLTLERHVDLGDEDRVDLLERLATNARKLDRLLKDLLDIDRLSRGIVAPQYRTIDVGALASRAVTSLEAPTGRSIDVDTVPVVISVDPAKVERIVENLLVNAVRHTEDDRRIWLRVTPHEGGALIAVEDDGAGVREDLREAIFEPFRQGPTISAYSPGTGIGLSLVSRFAALHGGRAWVEDRPGGGASFRVFLPGGPSIFEEGVEHDGGGTTGTLAGAG